ncbi:MAG: CehA/McbA family metallohydrolase [Chloroflexi bacterium]|nr:CehA/McbA family metallohydrolase [Chloroflexota bacterium]
MPTLEGRIWDRASGRPLEARVQVLDATGHRRAPEDAVHKVGPGEPFFYADRAFAVELPSGPADVIVERGTEYRPLLLHVTVPRSGLLQVDLPLERWIQLPEEGWYAGNTHVHYDEKETRALDRLRLDPRVEDLPVLVVSVLRRWDLAYASNVFPIGRHPISTPEHVVDVGEESRHNDEPWQIGYGHIMLVNLASVVEPVSRGVLVDASSPDYPPLVDACDAAHGQGGVVLWCHNGRGMEAPVAAALGRLDGLNLFDPYWVDPEYDIWYRLLNCGFRLPASTGSDWFVCSSNRVYADVGADFSYERWLGSLREGRTLVTNGPILRLHVAGHGPSNAVLELAPARRSVEVSVRWDSALPVDRVEIVRDGEVAAALDNLEHDLAGALTTALDIEGAGWIAARCFGRQRTSYGHALWAHTSPIYLRSSPSRAVTRAAASAFVEHIDRTLAWIATRGRFDHDDQKARMQQLYGEGRAVYERLTRN